MRHAGEPARGRELPVVPADRAAAAVPVCELDPVTGRCATCADEGAPGRVLSVGADGIGRVDVDGTVRDVALELLEHVRVGDRVLVHAGVAIARLEA